MLSQVSGFKPVGELAEEAGGSTEKGGKTAWWDHVNELQSLCIKCEEQGVTRIMPTTIPNFQEILVMAFECPHCGYRNTESRSATSIQEKGCRYDLTVTDKDVSSASL